MTHSRTSKSNNTPISPWLDNDQTGRIQLGHSFCTTSVRTVESHGHIFLAGDAHSHIHQILEGVVGIYKMLADGRRQIVTFCYPGDLIGIDHPDRCSQNAEALSPTRVRSIPLKAIDALIISEPGFGQAMMKVLSTELAETRDQLLSLGRKSAMEKVATFLLRIAKRNEREGNSPDVLFLPMTRSEIADYLGLTIETVSRNITKLKVAQIIRLETRSVIKILDMDCLEDIAEGESD